MRIVGIYWRDIVKLGSLLLVSIWGQKLRALALFSACVGVIAAPIAAEDSGALADPVEAGVLASTSDQEASCDDPLSASQLVESAILPKKTPIFVMLDQTLSTQANAIGDIFPVTVAYDVMDGDTVVIPKGSTGTGEVTFLTKKGGFGKPGILGIALRQINVRGKTIALDGRYREEGKNADGTTAATWFVAGFFSGFIKGGPGEIPKGRELKARTGENIPFVRNARLAASTDLPQQTATSLQHFTEATPSNDAGSSDLPDVVGLTDQIK